MDTYLGENLEKVKISTPYLIGSQCHEILTVVTSVFSVIVLCSLLEIFVVHDFSTVLHNKLNWFLNSSVRRANFY